MSTSYDARDEPKLRPPRTRRSLVPRSRLVQQLVASPAALVTVVAPAGYGKSTLLAQWARQDPRPFLWITLDDLDNDPAVLLGWLATAVGRLPGAGPQRPGRLTLRRVAGMLPRTGAPPVLVLDDAHRLHELRAIDTVTDLLPYLPEGAALAFGARTRPISVARLRVELDLLELGPQDLVLDDEETRAVLSAEGVVVDLADARRVRERTEGWAAAVTLAATAARRGVELTLATSGDERVVAEYLHSEVMARLDPATVEFLRRSAVLEQLSGPMCDSVLGRTGSTQLLEALAADHQLVLPVGAGRERFRYHPLLRDLLMAELRREDAGLVDQVRRRAADWCVGHGDPWGAVQYAYDAGDLDHAAHLVVSVAQPAWAAGRATTVQHWLERLAQDGVVDRHPEVAALWCVLHALEGRDAETDRWAAVALASDSDCPAVPGVPPLDALRDLLRALRCADGPTRMRADALSVCRLVPPTHPFLAAGGALVGIADWLVGETESAVRRLEDTLELAGPLGAGGAEIGAVGMLALIRADQHRWDEARALAKRGMATVGESGYGGYGLSGFVLAAVVRVADHDGDDAERRSATARYDALRPRMTHAMPYSSVLSRLTVATAHRAHGEWEAARTLIGEMRDILARRPELGRLGSEVAAFIASVGEQRGGGHGGSTLTVAELRLLPLLPTHLSFRGIGERLFLSQHTVKTQALSIYRKLAVTSRDQAVTRARELGLLED